MTENLEFQEKVKEASPEEQYKIYYEHGKILQKCRMFPLAVECFESIIAKSMDNIRPAGIDVYAYKAYQRKAQMYFDALCFQTAYECLSKAEYIIRDLYEKENTTQSRQMLEHRKIVAKYFRKFQKFDKALEILMDVYQIERKIYTQIVDEADQIEDVFKTEEEEQKESIQEDQDQEKSQPKTVEITEEVKEDAIDESTEDSDIDDDDMSKDISIRLGQTIIQIMEIHAFKNDIKRGLKYRDIAEKYILAATKDDKKNGYYIKFLQASGNMYMRSQNSKDLEKAYELYDEANSLLEEIVGKKSIDFLLSLVDIGEVYLYQKDHHKAEAFLGFCRKEMNKYYGKGSIWVNRVNSALIDVHSEKKISKKDVPFNLAIKNLDNAVELYGEKSIFTLGNFMSAISANFTKGNYEEVTLILSKMGTCLELNGEGANGNQFFFISSIINGMIAARNKDYEKATMFFSSTLRMQVEYVENERDHPFLEQTYYQLAIMYTQAGNMTRSVLMWGNVLAVGKRKYGSESPLLSATYKQIGMCQLRLGLLNESLKNLQVAKTLCEVKVEAAETKESKDQYETEVKELEEILQSVTALCEKQRAG